MNTYTENRKPSLADGDGRKSGRFYETLSPEAFANVGMPHLVYVREVRVSDLTREIGGIDLPPESRLYAIHAANGARMAVVDSRETAFAGARQHDLEPLSVH